MDFAPYKERASFGPNSDGQNHFRLILSGWTRGSHFPWGLLGYRLSWPQLL